MSASPSTGGLNTPPRTRKRKAKVTDGDTEAQPSKKTRPAAIEALENEPVLPVTPLTGTAPSTPASNKMDSEDDFMSGVSSIDEFDNIEESDDGLDFDNEDQDLGFSQDKDIVEPARKLLEVDYEVLGPSQIQQQQDVEIQKVADLFGQPPEAAAILLRHLRWNREKLIEKYLEDQARLLDEVGLEEDASHIPTTKRVEGFTCGICMSDDSDLDTYALKCGHRYCVDCYTEYLASKIRDDGEAARIQCPTSGCKRIVDSKSLTFLVGDNLKARYRELINRTYVNDVEKLNWCPAPECIYAISCGVSKKDLTKIVPTVTCVCKHRFCFGCGHDDHLPCPCALIKRWVKKCEDDSETANWISANTKECPKCQSTIEKNGGCNHMTCRKCKHEFCWMCMGLWSEHGTSWYNCSRFEEKSGNEARDAQAKSRQSLERYLHYYNRFANHDQSNRLEKDNFAKTKEKMKSLQIQSGMTWIEVQFLKTAAQTLQECRQTLKWTYAFAFYLASKNNETMMFEDNQKDLELATENLSEMFEQPIEQLSGKKLDILDKNTYCSKRRIILLNDTAKMLEEGKWKFNTELE